MAKLKPRGTDRAGTIEAAGGTGTVYGDRPGTGISGMAKLKPTGLILRQNLRKFPLLTSLYQTKGIAVYATTRSVKADGETRPLII